MADRYCVFCKVNYTEQQWATHVHNPALPSRNELGEHWCVICDRYIPHHQWLSHPHNQWRRVASGIVSGVAESPSRVGLRTVKVNTRIMTRVAALVGLGALVYLAAITKPRRY